MRGSRSESSRCERYNLRVEPTAYGGGSRANELDLNWLGEHQGFCPDAERAMSPVGTTGHRKEGKTMSTQAELVNVVQTESERLQQYLTALPADAWRKPSACALWDIRDVVAHLSAIAHAYTDRITRGLRGDTSPSPAGFPAPHIFQTLSGEERRQRATAPAQGTIALRERLGDDLLSVFGHAWEQFHQCIVTLTAHEWHQPCYHSCGIIPVHAVVHAGVFELAIHGWDIRSALEPSAPLAPDVLAAILDFFAECPHWFFLCAARLSTPIRYRFAFTGALSRQWGIVVEGDTADMGPAADTSPAHATFRCDGETFVLMICGRIDFDAALGDKRIIPTGDMAAVQAFKQWFQGV